MTFEPAEMTKDEFRAARVSLGLTRPEAARVLNVTVDTLRIWEGAKQRESGLGPHPTAIAFLNAILADEDFTPPNWPERLIETGEAEVVK